MSKINGYGVTIEHVDSGDCELLVFNSRAEAEAALDELSEAIDDFGWDDEELDAEAINDIIKSANQVIDIDESEAYNDDENWSYTSMETSDGTYEVLNQEPFAF